MQRTWGKYDSKSAARGGAISANKMVPVDDANPEGPKERQSARTTRNKIRAAVSPEELAMFRAVWLAESGGVQPMNDHQLIMFGMDMLKNPR